MHKIRFIENFHIVLWLIKDSCWLVQFKIGGVIMIVPTIGMALYGAPIAQPCGVLLDFCQCHLDVG
jgi:hypothetical protein